MIFKHTFVCILLLSLAAVATANEPFTAWRYQNKGTSNYHSYGTVKVVPLRAEIRIKIVHEGNGYIRLDGDAEDKIKVFNRAECKAGNILKYTVEHAQKIRVCSCTGFITPENTIWHKVKRCRKIGNYHQMTFDGGLVINIKIVVEEF